MRLKRTAAFADWFDALRDQAAKRRILVRIARIEAGLMGDVKALGGGISEARIDCGPGYRLYFTVRDREIILLLLGGDKKSQARDIARAREMAAAL